MKIEDQGSVTREDTLKRAEKKVKDEVDFILITFENNDNEGELIYHHVSDHNRITAATMLINDTE